MQRAHLSLKGLAMSTANLSPALASAYVALGGGIGALARYQLGRTVALVVSPASGFPWATLTVNVLGSLAMGALMGWFARGGQESEALRLAIGVGLLGGFTTFSAFSAELVTLTYRGQLLMAFGYGTVSIMAGMAALVIGLVCVQSIP